MLRISGSIPVAAIKATASASRISAVTSCHPRGQPALWGSNGRSGASSWAGSICRIRTPRSSKCKGYDRPSEVRYGADGLPRHRNCQLLRPCPVHLQNGRRMARLRWERRCCLLSPPNVPFLFGVSGERAAFTRERPKFASRFVGCAVKSRKEGCMAHVKRLGWVWSAF